MQTTIEDFLCDTLQFNRLDTTKETKTVVYCNGTWINISSNISLIIAD